MTTRLLTCFVVCVCTAVASVSLGGCKMFDKDKEASVSPGAVGLCSGCGQIAGSALCCAEGAATCSKCGLAKGAPGCCVMEKGGKAVSLCMKCGQVKGSDSCCAPGAAMCTKCGLTKGSPGCCKIK